MEDSKQTLPKIDKFFGQPFASTSGQNISINSDSNNVVTAVLEEKPTEQDLTIIAVGDTSTANHMNMDDVCMAHIRAQHLEEPQASTFFENVYDKSSYDMGNFTSKILSDNDKRQILHIGPLQPSGPFPTDLTQNNSDLVIRNKMHQQYIDMNNVAAATKTKKTRKTRQAISNTRKERIQTRASASAEAHQEQNNTMYATHYSMANASTVLNSNQVLYPNMMHVPSTMSYPMPQQMAHPPMNSTTEQPLVPRYNTRRAVQNLSMDSAPDMSGYYNTPRHPVSRQSQYAQQMNMPVPVEYQLRKQTKEQSSQTDLNITADEHQMLKLLRSKRITELSQLQIIIEKSHRYDQKPPEVNKEDHNQENTTSIRQETYNQIIEYSNFSKYKMLNYMGCFVKFQEKNAMAVQQQTRAIQYQAVFNQAMANQSLPQGISQSNQQQLSSNTSPGDKAVNTQTPNQQRMPEVSQSPNEGLQIQTLIGNRNTPPPRVPYISPHLLQAATLYLNNDYNPYGMSQYFQNRPPNPPSWGT